MTFTSLAFIEFLIAVVIVYFVAPKRMQWVVVLAANIAFYAFSGIKYMLYMLFTTAVTFYGAIVFENINKGIKEKTSQVETQDEKKAIRAAGIKKKKQIAFIMIFAVMFIWAVLKYGNFVIDNLNALFASLGAGARISRLSLVPALGMSFYTFQATGYMVDVYRGKYPAQRNYIKYFTFVSYFPHIMQGPFSRYDILGKSILEEHDFSYDRLAAGVARIIWGFFKKIVIADQIGIPVDKIFDNYQNYTGFNILCVIFLYAIQIYADFSGYMDIVCGFSKILGIDLQENFNQPYFSKSIEEFWRRWHMTLCQWFKDYLFYPISMSKPVQRMGKNARNKLGSKWGRYVPVYFALFFVWTSTGLWHGANWTYLIWGYLNFIVITCSTHWAEYYIKAKNALHIKDGNPIWEGFRILRTFALVALFRFFAVADTVSIAVGMIKRIFTDFAIKTVLAHPSNILPGLSKGEIVVLGIGTIVLVLVDVFREKGKWEDMKKNCPPVVRGLIFAGMLLLIMLIVPALGDAETGEFMYANF